MAAAAAPAAAAAAPAAPASALARRQAGKMAEVFGFVVYDGYDGGFAAAHAAAADWAGAQWCGRCVDGGDATVARGVALGRALSRAQARLPLQVSKCDRLQGAGESQLSAGGGAGSYDFAGDLVSDAAPGGLAGAAAEWKTTDRAADAAEFDRREQLWKWVVGRVLSRLLCGRLRGGGGGAAPGCTAVRCNPPPLEFPGAPQRLRCGAPCFRLGAGGIRLSGAGERR
jgi:hypothetical protein